MCSFITRHFTVKSHLKISVNFNCTRLCHGLILVYFSVSLQGKIGETGETGPKGFPVSFLIYKTTHKTY